MSVALRKEKFCIMVRSNSAKSRYTAPHTLITYPSVAVSTDMNNGVSDSSDTNDGADGVSCACNN